ncbi:endonuclease VII [Microbacterium phage A3Wally]|nr:endonuclease VII [Microbacterium phage A3Wally]
MPLTKLCKTCGETKLASEFHKNKSTKDGLFYRCKECNSAHVKKWQQSNPDYWKTQKGRSEVIALQRRARTYGITVEEVRLLMAETHCEICDTEIVGHKNIDHDHATGKVRGVLCGPCNRALGIFQDDEAVLQKAIDYLKKHRT